jgi:hypothetical protein
MFFIVNKQEQFVIKNKEIMHCKSRGVAATPKRCIITLIRCNAEINTVRV